ncbi:MAG: hypothetical protein AAFY15_08835, partial [Cyanobacteria bacterium J06648_11]
MGPQVGAIPNGVDWVADLDEDGLPEAIVGAAFNSSVNPGVGEVLLIDGNSGSSTAPPMVIWSQSLGSVGGGAGFDVARLGDLDADGRDEIGVSAETNSPTTPGSAFGSVFVLSSASFAGTLPALSASPPGISPMSGGFQSLSIDAGPARAGQFYWILGSASASGPAVSLGELFLPLTLDAYTNVSINLANSVPFVNTFGVLDATGKGFAGISVPPQIAVPLTGTVLRHACITIDSTGVVTFTSNAATLSL